MTLNASGIRRAAILFSGGPAPGANAVIQAAASSFKRSGCEVVGILHGYSHLQSYRRGQGGLEAGRHYRLLRDEELRGLRNARGVLIGTSRANPAATITGLGDLDDPAKTVGLRAVVEALVDLGVDALVSIGGDDTLRTANLLHAYQARLPANAPRVRVVHVPKTIDNDYRGIDFTFGFFTAVGVMADALQNLRADAMATQSYFVVETMGRSAGWLAYGVAIAGEAHMVVAAEDVHGALLRDGRLDLDALADRVVDLLLAREANGKHYGTVVLAEGLTELLPDAVTHDVPRDEHGHISLGKVDLARMVAARAAARFRARTGREKKLVGVQLGYESRSSAPHAFDVMLGCQLGVGAYRALVEQGLDAVMVSVTGQLDLRYVPFGELVDAATLRPELRRIEPGSDFHRLARELETRLNR